MPFFSVFSKVFYSVFSGLSCTALSVYTYCTRSIGSSANEVHVTFGSICCTVCEPQVTLRIKYMLRSRVQIAAQSIDYIAHELYAALGSTCYSTREAHVTPESTLCTARGVHVDPKVHVVLHEEQENFFKRVGSIIKVHQDNKAPPNIIKFTSRSWNHRTTTTAARTSLDVPMSLLPY